MGINIGLDIGAISLKLAALGKPADRPTLESVCAAHPEFRLISLDDRPLLLSDYRRISGSPIQSTYDLLRELYEIIPEDRVEGMRVTGSGSRTIAKVLGLFFENEFKAIARMIGDVVSRRCARCSNWAARVPSTSGWRTAASRTTTARASARPARDRSWTSRRCACSTRWKRWANWCAARVARRGSRDGAACSPRAT